jgi:hypothetical protein
MIRTSQARAKSVGGQSSILLDTATIVSSAARIQFVSAPTREISSVGELAMISENPPRGMRMTSRTLKLRCRAKRLCASSCTSTHANTATSQPGTESAIDAVIPGPTAKSTKMTSD